MVAVDFVHIQLRSSWLRCPVSKGTSVRALGMRSQRRAARAGGLGVVGDWSPGREWALSAREAEGGCEPDSVQKYI